MKRLVMLVGPPACGKSTVGKQLEDKGFYLLSADSIRQQMFGDAIIQADSRRVFSVFFDRLEFGLKKGRDIVIDNTNVYTHHRQQILERARRAGYEDIQLWIFETPLDVCLQRNAARERNVPAVDVERLHVEVNGPSKPTEAEGELVWLDGVSAINLDSMLAPA